MAFDTLILKNPTTGEIVEAPVGFSFISLFFGPVDPLLRADWLYAAIFFVIFWFTLGVSNVVFAFIYNKLFIKDKIFKRGFKVVSSKKGDLQKISTAIGLELPMIA